MVSDSKARNFTVKYTLDEAIEVRIALKSLLSDLLQKIGAAAPGDMKALQVEAGRIEDMLARDF